MALWISPAQKLQGQTFSLQFSNTPLVEALDIFATQSGLDFVFAYSHLQDIHTSCQFAGTSTNEALNCLFKDTGLTAVIRRGRQYLIIPALPIAALKEVPQIKNKSIKGYIYDASTGEVLPGAHIKLINAFIGTTTNPSGYFKLDVTGNAPQLRISYLGYTPIDTLILSNTPHQLVEIRLTPEALMAPGVLIEAAKWNRSMDHVTPGLLQIQNDSAASAPVIGQQDDLFQSLQWTPGVQKVTGLSAGLHVRGGGGDQNLFLLEGAPVYHPWHAFSLLSTFQNDTFSDVKLYRGAFPAQYGGRLSSVLDIQLKDGNIDEPRAHGALSLISGRFVIEAPVTKKTSFMVSGRRSYLDKIIDTSHPVEDNRGIQDTLRTGYHFSDISAKIAHRFSAGHNISMSYYTGRDVLDLRLPFDLSLDFSSWLKPADLFFEVDHQWGNTVYAFRHQYVPTRFFSFSTNAYRSSYNAREGALIQPSFSALTQSNYSVRVRDMGVSFDARYYGLSGHEVQAGVNLIDHQFSSALDARIQRPTIPVDTLRQQEDISALEMAAFVEDAWNISDKLYLQTGLRFSYFENGNYHFLSPRISLQYTVHPQYLMLKGTLGRQVQYMQRLRDRYSFLYDLISSRWIPTSESLRPSTGLQTSLELESRPLPRILLRSEFYVRRTDDILLPRNELQTKEQLYGAGIDLGTLLAQYTPGISRAYGAELSSQVTGKTWHALVHFSASRSLSRAPELNEINMRPTRYDVPLFFRAAYTRIVNGWSLSLSSVLRSGYPVTDPVTRYTLTGPLEDQAVTFLYRPEINNGRLPGYSRLDFIAERSFSFLGAASYLQLYVYNITNRRNVIDRYYDPSQSELSPQTRKGLPILPLIEFGFTL